MLVGKLAFGKQCILGMRLEGVEGQGLGSVEVQVELVPNQDGIRQIQELGKIIPELKLRGSHWQVRQLQQAFRVKVRSKSRSTLEWSCDKYRNHCTEMVEYKIGHLHLTRS
jgi:nitrate/nitrite-specific signal transduction histidine kinase